MKRIDLDEYATSAPLDLILGEVEALRLHRAVEITPIVDGGQPRWVVRARQHVGILQLGELELRIHPKVSVDRLFFLLAYATDADGWLDSPTEVGEASDLVEAIARAFVLHSEHALTPGILQGYVTTEDSLLTLRGRLREGDQVRARLGMPIPLEVTYDDFSSDIAENQLLRSAAEILLRFPLDAPVRHRITRLRRSLGDVTVLNVGAALPTVAFTRLNHRYRPATTLATLILRARSIEFDDPDVPGTAFLFDMNQVYEDFLTVALRRALEARGGRVAGQYRTYLDEASRIVIKPDVTWWLRSRCHAVVDAKYKAVSGGPIPSSDVYQVFAYCTAMNLPVGHLVYPTGEAEPTVHVIRHAGIQIQVHTLSLAEPPSQLLAAVEVIAARIAEASTPRHLRIRSA